MRILACGVLAAAVAFFQVSSAQPPSTGSVDLSGRVITGTGPEARPVRHARVTLSAGGSSTSRSVSTDGAGTYRFGGLAAGDYTISVTKPGFVRFSGNAGDVVLVRGAAIEGSVTSADGEPLENVLVAALTHGSGGAPGAAEAGPGAQTRTDDLGRFRIHSLAAGDYVVVASVDPVSLSRRGMPVPANRSDLPRAYYPAAGKLEDAKSVHLTAGLESRGIDIALPAMEPPPSPATPIQPAASPGDGRIRGKITAADSGKPIKNATVTVVAYGLTGGRNSWTMPTDGAGAFEFSGLAPARYQVTARAAGYLTLGFGQKRPSEGLPTDLRDIDLRADETFSAADVSLPRPSAIEGTTVDEFGDPLPGVIVQPARPEFVAGRTRLLPVGGRTTPTDDKGHFRIPNLAPGMYYVAGLAGAFGDGSTGGLAPTYYPGSLDPSSAQAVRIEVGDTSNLVLAMQPARTFAVAGRVVDGTGQPVGRQGLVLVQTNGGDVVSFVMGQSGTAPDGTFRYGDVPAGSYVVQAFGSPAGRFGSVDLRVDDADVTDMTVKVSDGAALRGRLTFEGNAPLPKPEEVRIFPRPVEFVTSPVIGSGAPPSHVNADWTFEVSGMSGLRAFGAIVPGWTIRSVSLDGHDVTDIPLDFRKGNVENLEVIMTSRVGSLNGIVTDTAGSPVLDYAVVVFAANRARWAFPSRFIVLARPLQTGGFKAGPLPPEDYLAAAIPSISGFEWQDPALLDRLRAIATSVSLAEGESKTLELKLKRRP
jgi:protocatechuate 3,4-dioxygenase beta subunit